jgi:hypothetical protein
MRKTGHWHNTATKKKPDFYTVVKNFQIKFDPVYYYLTIFLFHTLGFIQLTEQLCSYFEAMVNSGDF